MASYLASLILRFERIRSSQLKQMGTSSIHGTRKNQWLIRGGSFQNAAMTPVAPTFSARKNVFVFDRRVAVPFATSTAHLFSSCACCSILSGSLAFGASMIDGRHGPWGSGEIGCLEGSLEMKQLHSSSR